MSHEEEEQRVIEDWRDALENLSTNARHEIISLTSIARDYTSYAFGISESLEEYIKKAPPQRKLPLIYLLDSIVKNIGTPYTLFFGKNLYQTFMDAYASVNDSTRRKMEEMLKTWKEPVPGSIDKNPVFPADSVRPIETALIKARTSALQAQQEQMRSQHQLLARGGRPQAPYRATPTPPNARQPFNQPPYPGVNNNRQDPSLGGQQAYHQQQPQQQQQTVSYPGSIVQPPSSAPAAAPFQPPQGSYGAPAAQAGQGMDSLNNDIDQLIVAVGAALGRSPHSPDIQTELKALLALQGLLKDKHRNLPQEQSMAVRNQVDHLAVKYRVAFARPSVTATPPIPAIPFHAPMQQQQQPPYSVAPMPPASAPPASVSLDSLLGKGALAALLNRQSATPQPVPTPQMPPAALRSPTPQRAEPAKAPTPDPMALLGALRNSGLLPPTLQPGQVPANKPFVPPPAPGPVNTPAIPAAAATPVSFPPNLASILAQARNIAATAAVIPVISSGEFSFKVSSLKQPRLHYLHSLYDALGPPCTQCGRRFLSDEEGKKKKTAHMDWHFRVHQRMIEAEKRGQHRSWYVDQADWIRSVETIDLDHHPDVDDGSNPNTASSVAAGPKIQYIPVPDDGDTTNSVCPICQEKFVTKWLDEAQEWVWTDALRVGGRAYHASCYAEVTKDGGGGGSGTPMYSRATPDPVLGKRKAEDDIITLRGGRIKTDPGL